jgi:flagellar protein FliS
MLSVADTYRTTQVATTSPAGQVVLLYEGAIRHAARHLAALERADIDAAHHASLRAQAIVTALREVLDLSTGPIAEQLDLLYDFILDRLVDGNVRKTPKPTEEAIGLLRELLEAWRTIAGLPTPSLAAVPPAPTSSPSMSTSSRAPGALAIAGIQR